MQVRPAIIEDREFILSLAQRFAEPNLPPWRNAKEVTNSTRHRLDEALTNVDDRSQFLLAEDQDSAPAGFAWMRLIRDPFTLRDVAKLEEIAVARDGTGAGRILMEAAEAWARLHGCKLLVLNVLEENHRARRFYERLGFRPEYTLMTKELLQ